MIRIALIQAFLALCSNTAFSQGCESGGDLVTRVQGINECLVMRRYGPENPKTMIVWIHGDLGSGGPANYHFPIAQKAAVSFLSECVLSIAIVRPGYPDGEGNTSTGNNHGRSDSYTRDNIAEIGATIDRLRLHFKPDQVIIIGHSGGAACAAVLAGMRPDIARAFVLVSCPGDLVAWRTGKGRSAWTRSENPVSWIDKVSHSIKIIAISGSADDNTIPALARNYVDALKAHGVDAVFTLIPGETHNSVFSSPAVFEAVKTLLVR